MTARRTVALACLLALAAVALAAPMSGATDSNPGTIKVHDEADVEPSKRNQPHVDCEFFVEGFAMADLSGILEFTAWEPTGDKVALVLTANWSADAEGNFRVGPFTLPAGHYRVEAFSTTGHPGGNEEHFAKAKMFWVEPCANPPPPTPPPPVLACPTGLAAEVSASGSVTLTFAPAAGSNGTNIYRLDADGDFQLLATVGPEATSYTDTTAVAGSAYTYAATALFGDRESQECPIADVTPIPEFPSLLAMGLAATLGFAAFAVVRRKK